MNGTDASGTDNAARVADLLLCFALSPRDWGITELSRETGVSKAVAHRALQSLVSRGLVQRAPAGRYRLGAAAYELGSTQQRDERLIDASVRPLRELWAASGQTVFLTGLGGFRRTGLVQLESLGDPAVSIAMGRARSVFRGSTGLALLSRLDDETVELARRFNREPQAMSPMAFLPDEVLRAARDRARADGFAISQLNPGAELGSVSAPIVNGSLGVIGAVTVLGIAHQLSDDRLRELGHDAAVIAAAVEAEFERA